MQHNRLDINKFHTIFLLSHAGNGSSLVQNDTHKAEIYKYLWLLMTSQDPEAFQH